MAAWFRWLAEATFRHYKIIILISTMLTFFCSFSVYKLIRRLETDIAALIPKNYPSVKTLEDIKERVGGVSSLIILVECDDYGQSKKFVDNLAKKLQEEAYKDYVNYINYKTDVGFFKNNALLFMELEDLEEIQIRIEDRIALEKLKLSPLYISLNEDDETETLDFSDIEKKYLKKGIGEEPYYANPSRTILALEVVAIGTVSHISFTKEMYNAISQAVLKLDPLSYHPEMTISFGGTFKNKIDEYDVIIHDIKSTLVYGVLGVVLLLTFYFRQPLAVFFVAVPLSMGLIWTFSITYWVIGNLNTMTGFLFVILFGLGIDFGIHMFARYLEERMQNMDVQQSIELMMCQTGKAVFTAAMTTSMAFFSLTITDFKGFSEFGFIVGTGIIMSLVSMVTVLPAVLVLADKKLNLVRLRPVWGHNWDKKSGGFPYARLILVVGLILTIYFGTNLHRIKFEYDFTNLRSNLSTSIAVKEKINTISPFNKLSQSPSVVLADTKAELDEIVSAMEVKMVEEDLTPTIDTVKTLWSFLPKYQEEKLAILNNIRGLINGEGAKLIKEGQRKQLNELRNLTNVKALKVGDLPESILRKFDTIDGSLAYFAFIYPSVQLRDGKNAIAFAEDSQEIRTPGGKIFYSSSSSIIFADMLRLMLRDSPMAIGVTLVVVFLIVLADFRVLRSVVLVMLPLICGAFWMLGIMYLSGMKLNFYNMVALPTIIGMGIDNGIHLYHRYHEEGPGSWPLVIKSTGGAMLISMLTTMVGFFGLMLAQHPGLNSIGKLALIGLFTCFLAAAVVLPALLEVLGKRIILIGDRSPSK